MEMFINNSRYLGAIVVMQALILLGQWTGPATLMSPAHAADAQVSNPGERQLAMLDELRGVNTKLDKLLSMLAGGEVQVKVVRSDDGNKPDNANK